MMHNGKTYAHIPRHAKPRTNAHTHTDIKTPKLRIPKHTRININTQTKHTKKHSLITKHKHKHEQTNTHTWWALQMRSKSCLLRNLLTTSAPKVKLTPLFQAKYYMDRMLQLIGGY